MTSKKQLAYSFLFFLGVLLIFCAYKINEDQQKQVYVQQHSPLIKLPVVYRYKGWGTLRFPNKIYVRYRGKVYPLLCSNNYFKNTLGLDSVVVHYDSVSDRAILANSPITRSYGPLLAIALAGFFVIGKAVVEIYRQLAPKRVI